MAKNKKRDKKSAVEVAEDVVQLNEVVKSFDAEYQQLLMNCAFLAAEFTMRRKYSGPSMMSEIEELETIDDSDGELEIFIGKLQDIYDRYKQLYKDSFGLEFIEPEQSDLESLLKRTIHPRYKGE